MSETRGLEEQAGGNGRWPSQALIQLECAFTYMNAVSGENLSGVFVPMKFKGVSRTTHVRRSRRFTDRARFCRTTVTCIWGVSDPLFQGAEPRQEGGRGGRSRPRCLLHCR